MECITRVEGKSRKTVEEKNSKNNSPMVSLKEVLIGLQF